MAIPNLRCLLFGHDSVRVKHTEMDGGARTEAICTRCEFTTIYVNAEDADAK